MILSLSFCDLPDEANTGVPWGLRTQLRPQHTPDLQAQLGRKQDCIRLNTIIGEIINLSQWGFEVYTINYNPSYDFYLCETHLNDMYA